MAGVLTDVDEFYAKADPERENLCLYGKIKFQARFMRRVAMLVLLSVGSTATRPRFACDQLRSHGVFLRRRQHRNMDSRLSRRRGAA